MPFGSVWHVANNETYTFTVHQPHPPGGCGAKARYQIWLGTKYGQVLSMARSQILRKYSYLPYLNVVPTLPPNSSFHDFCAVRRDEAGAPRSCLYVSLT
jgi:hypothetical protein